MNSHACPRVLNNISLTCNYDYNIKSHLKKGDTYLLDFLIIEHISLGNIPIKLTYIWQLFSKNLFCNIWYLVSYLTRHKKFYYISYV
jgi:hypothetical protein